MMCSAPDGPGSNAQLHRQSAAKRVNGNITR